MSDEQQSDPRDPDPENSGEAALPSNVGPNLPPPTEQTTQSSKKVKTFLDYAKCDLKKPMVWIELVALIFLIRYTHYAGQQSQSMNDSLSEIRKQTKSIQRQADDADKSLRAYVVFEDAIMVRAPTIPDQKITPLDAKLVKWVPNAAFAVAVSFKNIGKSQAVRMRSTVNMELAEIPDRAHIYAAQEACFRHTVTLTKDLDRERPEVYGSDVAPQQAGGAMGVVYNSANVRKDEWFDYMILRPDRIRQLIRDKVMVIVAGLISYYDIFGSPHATEFCIGFASANPKPYSYCGTHNRIR